MWMQWGEQRDYIMRSWNVAAFVGTLFVIVNLCGQLVPCVMILSRKKTDIACGILVFIIAFQVSSIVFSRTRKNETADTSILNTILLMLPYVIRQLF
jgi:small neutral amino acid transporter SnatA (MarC family)